MVGERDVDQLKRKQAVARADKKKAQVGVPRKDLVMNTKLRDDNLKHMHINKGVLTRHY